MTGEHAGLLLLVMAQGNEAAYYGAEGRHCIAPHAHTIALQQTKGPGVEAGADLLRGEILGRVL